MSNSPGSPFAPRVGSVHRALQLLSRILDDGSISVTEAASLLGVNASTSQRLLATLTSSGFAAQQDDRRYGIGPALLHPRLTHAAPDLRARMRPALEALFDRCGETVHLSMLLGTQIEQIDAIEATTHQLRFASYLGAMLPAHLTAGGRAMLAELSTRELEARYALADREIDFDALRVALDTVRASRVATNLDESEPGIAAMAISVGRQAGSRAALSIAVPSARFTPELAARFRAALIGVADDVAAHNV